MIYLWKMSEKNGDFVIYNDFLCDSNACNSINNNIVEIF